MVYFLAFLLINVVLMTNLFVGVVCAEFQRHKQRKEGLTALSEGQWEWVTTQRILAQQTPPTIPRAPSPDSPMWRRALFTLFYHGPTAPSEPRTATKTGRSRAWRSANSKRGGERPPLLTRDVVLGRRGAGADELWGDMDHWEVRSVMAGLVFALNALSVLLLALESFAAPRNSDLAIQAAQALVSSLLTIDVVGRLAAIGATAFFR